MFAVRKRKRAANKMFAVWKRKRAANKMFAVWKRKTKQRRKNESLCCVECQ